ncbi:MAG TPA: hypothetical protein VFE50_15635 [Cyclobacteriaceae bacterium]|nr:hypothetical protein [Cyclobacteriaceae bacterium]
MKIKHWVQTLITAVLLHVALIAISILEVFIYSMTIVRGKTEEFYSKHAEVSGPWVSGIFGSLFIVLLVRRFIRQQHDGPLVYAIALPVMYTIIDLILIGMWMNDWTHFTFTTILVNGLKLGASLLSYLIFRRK